MVERDKIQFALVKLLNGGRLLRLTDPHSGLTLEKKLAPPEAVVRQKEKLLRALATRAESRTQEGRAVLSRSPTSPVSFWPAEKTSTGAIAGLPWPATETGWLPR